MAVALMSSKRTPAIVFRIHYITTPQCLYKSIVMRCDLENTLFMQLLLKMLKMKLKFHSGIGMIICVVCRRRNVSQFEFHTDSDVIFLLQSWASIH